MTYQDSKFAKDSVVVSKLYGKGVILSIEHVEQPSDGDHTFYKVKMANDKTRHLKANDLKAGE